MLAARPDVQQVPIGLLPCLNRKDDAAPNHTAKPMHSAINAMLLQPICNLVGGILFRKKEKKCKWASLKTSEDKIVSGETR